MSVASRITGPLWRAFFRVIIAAQRRGCKAVPLITIPDLSNTPEAQNLISPAFEELPTVTPGLAARLQELQKLSQQLYWENAQLQKQNEHFTHSRNESQAAYEIFQRLSHESSVEAAKSHMKDCANVFTATEEGLEAVTKASLQVAQQFREGIIRAIKTASDAARESLDRTRIIEAKALTRERAMEAVTEQAKHFMDEYMGDIQAAEKYYATSASLVN